MSDSKIIPIIFLGAPGVGKTCLITRYIYGHFEINPQTVGFSYFTYEKNINNEKLTLQIYDTAGQERFNNPITTKYYREAKVAVICFAYDDSIESIRSNINYHLKKIDDSSGECQVILAATKIDLYLDKEDEIRSFMDQFESPYIVGRFVTSAMYGNNVSDLFEFAASCETKESTKNEPTPNDPNHPKRCCG